MKYYSGQNNTDASPKPLPHSTFAEFVTEHLSRPVVCHVTSADYAAMDDKQKKRAKNTQYFTAAAFGGEGQRRLRNITQVNMLVLDIDTGAGPLLELLEMDEGLIPWNYCLWQTLTSTPDAPRIRLVVDSTPLTIDQYREGVRWLAARLRLEDPNPNPESLDPSHLWYHPSVFSDRETDMPLISSRVTGAPITPQEWGAPAHTPEEQEEPSTLPVEPVEGTTLAQAAEMLVYLDPDKEGYDAWLRVGMGLKHQFGDAGYELWDNWSARGPKYSSDTKAKFDSFKREDDPVTFRSIIRRAKAAGWTTGPSRIKAEKLISTSSSVDDLLGPILRSINWQDLTSTDVGILIGKVKERAKTVHGVFLRIPAIKEAIRALRRTSIPAELQGFVFVAELNTWVHPVKGIRFTPSAFDLHFASLLFGGRPSIEALNLGLLRVDREGYNPSFPTKLIYSDGAGATYLNTYRESYPAEDPSAAAEAGKTMEDHLALLFPSPSARDLLLSWMTWCLLNPGRKCHWHTFIQGVQGCGKSLVAEALAACFGPTNARKVGNHMLVEKYNSWSSNVLFLYFEEVLLGERQKDTMEIIKDLVTGQTANIRAMRTDAVEKPNMVVGGMFLSNHLHGLRLERSDRRFFCLCCDQQREEQALAIPRSHFVQLARLKGDLAGGLRHYLLTRPISPDFDPYGHAPHTPDRDLVMHAGATEVDHAIMTAIESGDYDLLTPEAISMGVLISAVRSDLRYCSAKTIARTLGESGWKRLGQRELSTGERHSIWYNPEKLNGMAPVERLNASMTAKEIL